MEEGCGFEEHAGMRLKRLKGGVLRQTVKETDTQFPMWLLKEPCSCETARINRAVSWLDMTTTSYSVLL